MVFLGYSLFGLVGVSLGLLGAGGAILTIPILVYVFHVPVVLATTYSLLIVGITAFLGVLRDRSLIAYDRALIFALPSLGGMTLSRRVFLPSLPEKIGLLSRDDFLIALLVSIMGLAAYFMIRSRTYVPQNGQLTVQKVLKIILSALFLGMLMGLLGAGGGFIIVPTLVLWLGFDMKRAVATSLFIIALNSLFGFAVDAHPLGREEYYHLALLTGCSVLGMVLGTLINRHIPSAKLKHAFGWFIAITALSISMREFLWS